MPRFFLLEEAAATLPEVERLLRGAVEYKREYERSERNLHAFQERVTIMGGVQPDQASLRDDRRRRDGAVEQLKNCVERITAIGCVIKDLDMGLVDFPTLYRGDEVYLCWKLGEPRIEFWHGLDEGYAGRKPIDSEFRKNHRGGEEEL